MTNLKPCPNPECGGMGVLMGPGYSQWVECDDCDMSGPSSCDGAKAARLWNALPRNITEVDPAEHPLVDRTQHYHRRDFFAAKAMQALILRGDEYSATGSFPGGLADDAWRVAEAMMSEGGGDEGA